MLISGSSRIYLVILRIFENSDVEIGGLDPFQHHAHVPKSLQNDLSVQMLKKMEMKTGLDFLSPIGQGLVPRLGGVFGHYDGSG